MLQLVSKPPQERADLDSLRAEVRAFLAGELAGGSFTPRVDSWLTGWDRVFSTRLAAAGLLGVTIPRQYGGQGRTHQERFVITEELLAAGAPVAAHWIADRQVAPSLLRFGSEAQKQRFLPSIAAGATSFAIGMSEPDSGSDLASVRSKATRVAGGWRLNGTKVWTSGAHHADAFIVLARTSRLDTDHRHEGLSQFIVDLRAGGVHINPIRWMDGSHHFNEVVLDDVLVPDEMVLGEVGNGWHQVTSELGYERSGPERFLSAFPLFAELMGEIKSGVVVGNDTVGRLTARLVALRRMSAAVAGALQEGMAADSAAAAVKVLGTTFEGDVVELAEQLRSEQVRASSRLAGFIDQGLVQRPGFTLRGGTNEVLRNVIAREVGLR